MSLQFMWISLLAWMIFEIGTILIGSFVDVTDAGLYYAANRIASLMTFVLYASNMMLGPMISEQHAKNNHEGIDKLYRLSLRLCIALSTVLAIILIGGGKFFLGLFGEGFVAAYPLLVAIVIGQLGNSFVGPTGLVLNMTGNQMIAVKILSVIGPVNVCLLYVSAIYFGSLGVAVTSATANIVTNIIFAFCVWKRLGIIPLPFTFKKTC
jgi:O-antigen/teichoic acid export membrane protein